MGRLTAEECSAFLKCYSPCGDDGLCNRCDRLVSAISELAEYKNTGLTPERCAELAEENKCLAKEVSQLAIESVRRDMRLAKLEAEVAHWANAEAEGRLVVLPYDLNIAEYPAVPVYYRVSDKNVIERHGLDCVWAHPFLCGLINRTVFFTREEAEAALAEREVR